MPCPQGCGPSKDIGEAEKFEKTQVWLLLLLDCQVPLMLSSMQPFPQGQPYGLSSYQFCC